MHFVITKSCLLFILLSIFISCNQDDIFTEATVDIVYITSITDTTIILEGLVAQNGGTPILKSGVCWSTSENPTIANNRTTDPLTSMNDGVPSNYFESSLKGLASSTRYYLRAYATNKVGTSYGRQVIVSTLTNTGLVLDIDGNEYKTVTIGDQTWLVENLKTTRYNDGTSIPNITDGTTWSKLTTPGYCWYNNDTTNKFIYGALYNWNTVETGKLAPTGWRVPSNEDWNELETYLITHGFNYDSSTTDDKIAKSLAATTGWDSVHEMGEGYLWFETPEEGDISYDLTKNNSSGFSALPAGIRSDSGEFYYKGIRTYWWCLWNVMEGWAYLRGLSFNNNYLWDVEYPTNNGFSVRCIRNF